MSANALVLKPLSRIVMGLRRINSHVKPPMRRAPAPPPAVSTHPLPPSGAQAVASATTAAAAPAELAGSAHSYKLPAVSQHLLQALVLVLLCKKALSTGAKMVEKLMAKESWDLHLQRQGETWLHTIRHSFRH